MKERLNKLLADEILDFVVSMFIDYDGRWKTMKSEEVIKRHDLLNERLQKFSKEKS